MKSFSILFCFFLFANCFGQKANDSIIISGIFKSYKDFKGNKPTYQSDCINDKNKFRLHDFFAPKPYFEIIHKGKKYSFQKNDVYAFRDCDNKVFRFFNNTEYEIVEAGNIFIYTVDKLNSQTKPPSTIKEHYFSATPTSEIQSLTVDNLKKAFPENNKFHDLLDSYFKNGAEISEYDNFNKIYKVNHLYKDSRKAK